MAEKATLERIENSETNISFVDHDLKEKDVKLDYSGAHEKSSPEEIRLVKKLDWWIMVSYRSDAEFCGRQYH